MLVCYARAYGLRVLFITLAVLAGLSRVAVGVHWPVDVAAGLMGGVLAGYVGVLLAERTAAAGRNLRVHLAFVALAVLMTATLTVRDGGYDEAALMLRVLGIGALSVATLIYLVLPLALAREETGRAGP